MAFRDSSPSTSRRGRSAIARTSTLALSMVAGSLALWATPASAVDLTADDLCVELFGVYWEISDFVDDGLTTTYTTGEQTVTFLSTIDLGVYDLADYEPRLEFFLDSQCVGTDNNPDSNPPENFKMCVAVTPGAASSFDFRFRRFPTASYGSYVVTGATQSTVYDLGGLTGGTWVDDLPFPDDLTLPGIGWIPTRIEPKNFALDPAFTDTTVQVQTVFALNPVCSVESGGGGGSGGRGPSIDLDYYIERAAAESSSLPDTL